MKCPLGISNILEGIVFLYFSGCSLKKEYLLWFRNSAANGSCGGVRPRQGWSSAAEPLESVSRGVSCQGAGVASCPQRQGCGPLQPRAGVCYLM